jgi:two-component system, LytTR family, response regulator
MKILIIEDEALVAKDLIKQIKSIDQTINILAIIESVDKGMEWFQNNQLPDLIISDIQLADGTSFEIFEKLQIKAPVIFTTAYNEYAIHAFKVNSIDYLLKPINKNELQLAIQKYKNLKANFSGQLQDLLQNWEENKKKKYKERFLCIYKHALIPIATKDIAFFHKQELIYIHTFTNEKYISEFNTLDEIVQLIPPDNFYRANRQYLVNSKSVGKINTTHKGISINLIAPFGNEIDISREKASDFKKWMGGDKTEL